MATFPALPLWTDALLADCWHLSDDQFGLYLKILILMWRSPECRIPNDDDWIARKLNRDADAVRTHMRPLMLEFCQTDANGDAWLTQKRLRKEWEWCIAKSRKSKEAAKSRWNKEKLPHAHAVRTHGPGICERNAPTPTPTPSSISSLRSDIPAWVPKEAWDGFVEMRIKIRAPMTERAKALSIAKLKRLIDSGQAATEVLDQSTANSWKGLFEVQKANGSGNGHGHHDNRPTAHDNHLAGIASLVRDIRAGG